ncbi:MAG TPA: peptidyl-prolyl cis-trans isomerase, partial [Fibrobacteria bacterium]|nr:peptidyl-prolyl cis-trans isomerase [Fibrobacteria bacterium]
MVRKTAAFASTILLAAALSGCKKEPVKATVLAQVGNSTLTLEELRESFPVEFEQLIRREQYLDFIKRWMDDEVVYQQALNAKLEADPAVGRKLEKLRRKLLIEEFLSRENASEVFEPDEMAMNQYYEMHKEEFRRKVPEVKFAHIRVQTNKQAAELRYKANRGDFLAVAAANSLDPVPESYASIAFKKQTEFPPCLSQDIAGAGIGAVTLPVACPDGFYLVKVLERQDAGSLIPFAEAKEEISGILVMERKDKLLEGRIAKYKEGISFSYNLDQVPGLAESPKGPETPKAAEPAPPQTVPAPAGAVKPKAIAPAAAAAPEHAKNPAQGAAPVPAAPAESRLPREPVPAASTAGAS